MDEGTERQGAQDEPRDSSGGNRPLSRRASRRLVIGGVIFAILFAIYTTIMINRTSNDPVVRDAVEEFQRQDGMQPAPPADTSAATRPD